MVFFDSTPPRSYRQIASLMGLQLVTSFVNVAKILGPQRETTQRQLDAEKKKNIEGPRVESLTKRLSMTHEKITTLEEMMRKIFTGYVIYLLKFCSLTVMRFCYLVFTPSKGLISFQCCKFILNIFL